LEALLVLLGVAVLLAEMLNDGLIEVGGVTELVAKADGEPVLEAVIEVDAVPDNDTVALIELRDEGDFDEVGLLVLLLDGELVVDWLPLTVVVIDADGVALEDVVSLADAVSVKVAVGLTDDEPLKLAVAEVEDMPDGEDVIVAEDIPVAELVAVTEGLPENDV
jgi:hypothetical protein